MRKIVAITYVSLDGVMQAPGGPDEDPDGGFVHGGWSMSYWDDMMNGLLTELLDRPFDLLLGRRTHDIFAGYWPKHLDNPVGRKFDAATKYVVTRGTGRLDWARSERIEGNAAEGVAKLKSGGGPDLHIWGSGNALQTLIAAGLVDEFRVWIFPLILGGGKRLFQPGLLATTLALTETRASATGVVISTYRPVGPVFPAA